MHSFPSAFGLQSIDLFFRMETIPFLTKEDVGTLDQILGDYLQKSEAVFSVVIDRGGTVIAQQGEEGKMDVTIVAALAAGSFAATRELARRIGEDEFSALYHQGKDHHILMNALDEQTIIITIFDEKTTVGLVRFYTVNVADQLVAFLRRLRERNVSDIPELDESGELMPGSDIFKK